jgi:hypothetical protein
MGLDFNPDLNIDDFNEPEKKPVKEEKVAKNEIAKAEAKLVVNNSAPADVVTMNNLLGLTQSHIDDDNACRDVVNKLTDELNDSIRLMSIKELIEYLKVKIREREFHVDCIFKAYSFIQKSEFAREMFAGSNRKERIVEVSDRKRITGLLNMLNNTD